jgi:alpha-maltose-1-phosphate synthase
MSGDTTGRLSSTAVKVALLTREYPPEVYGGAGVHVEYLAAALRRRAEIEVRCFGAPREASGVRAFEPWDALRSHSGALQAMSVNLAMTVGLESAEIVHSHTWYAQFGGHLAKLLYDVPHVATTHSLEPLRRWKSEQLGPGGYALSSFCERTGLEGANAIIAVSAAMREDILECYPALDPGRVEVIHNGIDPDEYAPDAGTVVLKRLGIDPAGPYVAFVGRITRQKGLVHLLDASLHVDADAQIVLCAGAPDTEEIAREVAERVEVVRERRGNVVWIEKMLTKAEVIQILSHATVFCCPSIYEPLGIVNLEAMACGTAVVAAATGGIPEVVEEGSTGYLVPLEYEDPITRSPRDPESFARAIAGRLEKLLSDPATAKAFGDAGRRRAIERFSWEAIADKTIDLYRRVRVSI